MELNFLEVVLGLGEFFLVPRLDCSPLSVVGLVYRFAQAAMRLEEIREFLDGRRVLAVGDVDDLAPRHVNEQADVIVAAPRRSLSGGDGRNREKFSFFTARPGVLLCDTSASRVLLAARPHRLSEPHRLGPGQRIGTATRHAIPCEPRAPPPCVGRTAERSP